MVYVEARTKPDTLKEGTQERLVTTGMVPTARPRVSVIIPALNEAANIPHVIAQVPEWVHEVVLVDGFSTDGTTEVAQRVWPNHHIVVMERRRGTERRGAAREDRSDRRGAGRALRLVQQTRKGKGNALHSGIAAATGEIIVMMDADGSTDPQEIGRFVDTLVGGADFAKGSRFLRNAGTYDMPRYRQLGNWGLVILTNILYGTRYTDITYGYNAFWKRHAGALALEIDGWPNEIISNIRVARHGLRVREVPSFEHPRLAGEAKLQGVFGVGWQIGREILRERFRPARMQTLMAPNQGAPTVDVTVGDDTITLRPEEDLVPRGHRMTETPAARPTVSVIICAYTEMRWEPLVEGIDGVRAQTHPADEIVVVIDHNDNLLERVRDRFAAHGVVVTANPRQRGISGARNHGVAIASGDIAVFLDDDATPYPDWLANMVKHYDDPSVYGVGGGLIARWETGKSASWIPQEFYWTISCNYRGLPTTQQPVRNLIGGNMSVRRRAFMALGGLQEGLGRLGTIPLGCEDTEFCIRLRRQYPAAIILHEPEARVSHLVTETRTRPRYFLSRCWNEGRSKALVARLVGTTDGLAAERRYTFVILPTGVLRHLGAVGRHGDIAGVGRAATIMAGLAMTTFGYLRGRLGVRGERFQLAPPAPMSPVSVTAESTAIDART